MNTPAAHEFSTYEFIFASAAERSVVRNTSPASEAATLSRLNQFVDHLKANSFSYSLCVDSLMQDLKDGLLIQLHNPAVPGNLMFIRKYAAERPKLSSEKMLEEAKAARAAFLSLQPGPISPTVDGLSH